MAQITNIITIHEYNKMTAEQRAALGGENLLAVVQQDWEEARINAAIAAMQSYISDGESMALVSKKFDYDDKIISKFIAEGAVMYADALIAELQKKQD